MGDWVGGEVSFGGIFPKYYQVNILNQLQGNMLIHY